MRKVDVAIIGAGSAGMSAYRVAKEEGKSAVLIERDQYGTTCARVGCMPSKLLIAASEVAHTMKMAPEFGIHPESVNINTAEVMRRVKSERNRFVNFVKEDIHSFDQKDLILGHARFKNDNVLDILEYGEIEANSIVIASGSSPVRLPMFQKAAERVIFNDDLFNFHNLPKKIAVFGAGVIGLELGQALHRLGVEVRVFGIESLIGPVTDPVIRDEANRIFGEELNLSNNAKVLDISMETVEYEKYVSVNWEENEETFLERFDYLLAATGRFPNVKGLKLENTSLELNEKGIPEFDPFTLQCLRKDGLNSNIFIAGDVNNERPILHEAIDEGKAAGLNAAHFPDVTDRNIKYPLSIVFSDPQIAMVGKTYQQLRLTEVEIGEVDFSGQGRSRTMLKNKGKLRIYANKSRGRFLGAEMIGPAAEHLAHLLAWSIENEMTIAEMLEMPFYHPVIEEGLRTALRNVNKKLTTKE